MPGWWPIPSRSPIRRALQALERVEVACAVLPSPSTTRLRVGDWWATRLDAPLADLGRLPGDERVENAGAARSVWARTSATAVRMAKLGDRSVVRARAFYLDVNGTPLSIKIAAGPPAELARIRREVAARTEIGRDLPTTAIVDTGTTNGVAYVAEDVVFGCHPTAASDRQALAMRLVDDLIAFHRGRGVVDGPLVLHPSMQQRLARLFSEPWLIDLAEVADLDARGLATPIAALAADRRPVPVGWGHGDLGFSNVIVTAGGDPVMVDWEHAGTMPAVTDLAKLAVMAPQPTVVAHRVLTAATPDDIGDRDGRMSLRDQLAVVIAQELSWWETRLMRATAAGRRDPFERGVRRRLRLLCHLVKAGAGAEPRP